MTTTVLRTEYTSAEKWTVAINHFLYEVPLFAVAIQGVGGNLGKVLLSPKRKAFSLSPGILRIPHVTCS